MQNGVFDQDEMGLISYTRKNVIDYFPTKTCKYMVSVGVAFRMHKNHSHSFPIYSNVIKGTVH